MSTWQHSPPPIHSRCLVSLLSPLSREKNSWVWFEDFRFDFVLLHFLDAGFGFLRCLHRIVRDLWIWMWVLRSAPMMFDWNDQDQVGETIWGEFNESGDHTVPFPKDTEEHQVFTFDACSKKQRNDDAKTIAQSTGQSSGAKNDFPGYNLENSSSLNANEDHSGPRLDMDTWPDLPSLNAELSTGELSSLNKSLSPIAGRAVQLDGESELFGNAREDKENDSFLDCDWANIGDFDDLDRIFRNESIFGHDMVPNVDEFLSSSVDMVGSTVQSIPMPDITLSRDQPSDQGCSSFQLVEHSGRKRKAENKILWKPESKPFAKLQIATNSQKRSLRREK